MNTAADFHSRSDLKVTEKIRLKIRQDVQTTLIGVTTSSSDVADEELFFFAQVDGEDETEQQTLESKEQSRKKETEWVAHEEPFSMKPSIKEFTKIAGNTKAYSIHGIEANARIRIEQDVDLVLKNIKLKILGQPYDEVLLAADKRFKHYKAKEDRIILNDGLLFRMYNGETDNMNSYQILIPKQLVDKVLRSLHAEFGKHPGITKTISASRQKYYYPNMAKLIRQWVMSSEQCVREPQADDKLT